MIIERKADQQFDSFMGIGVNHNARSYRRFYKQYLSAVMDTSLSDWIAAFPEAVTLGNAITVCDSDEPTWFELSKNPLVNAMLSNIPVSRQESLTGTFNFPGPDRQQFTVAFLASCADDAVCEHNIDKLKNDADIKSFQEYNELLNQETVLHSSCLESVLEIQSLSASQPGNASLQRMCYSSLITAMEAYLGDILKREIFSRHRVKQRFVASYEPFTKQRFNLSDIYNQLLRIDIEIKDALDRLSLHKIDTAKNIFRNLWETTFPVELLPSLGAAVKRRHDIVHRNGKNTEGELLLIECNDVADLAERIQQFTRAIDAQILNDVMQDIIAERD